MFDCATIDNGSDCTGAGTGFVCDCTECTVDPRVCTCNGSVFVCDYLPYCGNGIPEEGEECDDGNENDADACRNNCTLSA